MIKFIIILTSVFFLISCESQESIFDSYSKKFYRVEYIEGWRVCINESIVHTSNWLEAKKILSFQLYNIKRVLAVNVVKEMQKIKFYVEDRPDGRAEYHPSRDWLIKNGFSPEKEHCVELSDINGFINKSLKQPWVILHELIHGYHHLVLGFDNQEIIECYYNALKSNKYQKVKFYNNGFRQHYGGSNFREYFAEAGEAYFGINDFYPFNRRELIDYDPEVCRILKKLSK